MRPSRPRLFPALALSLILPLIAPLIAPKSAATMAADSGGGEGAGVVWLTGQTEGAETRVQFRVPLEWLARLDEDKKSNIKIDDETIDCVTLWNAHKDLPIGETREVKRGVAEDGDRYVLHVVSEMRAEKKAEGKIHILARNAEGKTTDLRFPLDIAGVVQTIGGLIASLFGREAEISHEGREEIRGFSSLTKLADYGSFVAVLEERTDGGRTKITIE